LAREFIALIKRWRAEMVVLGSIYLNRGSTAYIVISVRGCDCAENRMDRKGGCGRGGDGSSSSSRDGWKVRSLVISVLFQLEDPLLEFSNIKLAKKFV
jgi:hypothetical protein